MRQPQPQRVAGPSAQDVGQKGAPCGCAEHPTRQQGRGFNQGRVATHTRGQLSLAVALGGVESPNGVQEHDAVEVLVHSALPEWTWKEAGGPQEVWTRVRSSSKDDNLYLDLSWKLKTPTRLPEVPFLPHFHALASHLLLNLQAKSKVLPCRQYGCTSALTPRLQTQPHG